MKGLRFYGPHDLRYEDVPLPNPKAEEVRIRPQAVGICGTDVHILDGSFSARPPVILGHEIAGVVDAIGSAVSNVKEGDLVTIEPHRFCGTCRYCRMGKEHLCLNKEAFGVHLDGGMAEAVVVPARIAYQLPTGITPNIGCLAEPAACCVHAVDRLEPISGLTSIIFGAGPAGLILLRLLKIAGMDPVVIEPDVERRKKASVFGAQATLDPFEEGWEEKAITITNHSGYDFIIEAVGSGEVLKSAIPLAARGARILVFGVADPQDIVPIRPQEVFIKELTILGTVINPYTHHRAVELLPDLNLNQLKIINFTLPKYEDAFNAHKSRESDKIVFTPQSENS